ncbi:MAG: gliding motility-associated C-terminal domain-containing protein [Cytophagales bacterium]|nr:gliding motility-associated C-terminal domain-containing protein [Cytophagales bacterium]
MLSRGALAQKEGNIWYFGAHGGGLDFNFTPAKALRDGQLIYGGREAAIMADECGKLLFYSDGHDVRNRQHQVMPNGQDMEIGGNTQRAVALPVPGKDSLYILFTSNGGLSYSLIDMRLDSGRGAVTTRKVFLYPTGTDQMTAARHANGKDFWLLATEAKADPLATDNNRFLAFRVDERGVHPQPVVSLIPDVNFVRSQFRVRASPDSRKVIVTGFFKNAGKAGAGLLLSFDNATGWVTHTTLVPEGGFGLDYDFSPDSKKVYAELDKAIYQYQIDRPTGEEIARTRTLVPNSRQAWSMRLAPDGRIYVSVTGGGILDVITNPNEIGPAVRLVRGAHSFSSVDNLPNNLAGYALGKQKDFRPDPLCEGREMTFTPQTNYRVVRYYWHFGDPASGPANESNEEVPSHTFSGSGRYNVRMVTLNRCQEYDTVLKTVTIYPDPVVDIPEKDVKKCFSEVPVTFSVRAHPFTRYRWNTGDTTSTIEARQTGWYRVEASNPCGTHRDSVYLDVTPEAVAYLPDDTIFCDGNFARLDARNEGAAYRWSTGETSRIIEVDKPGTYWVEIRNECSATVDSTRLVFIREDVSAFIPNVFTPNGDGYNDSFQPLVLNTPAYSLTIVNRWGRQVFYSRNPFQYWQGRVDGGEEAAPGMYFWRVTATGCRGEPVTFKGFVSLLR